MSFLLKESHYSTGALCRHGGTGFLKKIGVPTLLSITTQDKYNCTLFDWYRKGTITTTTTTIDHKVH